MIMKQILPLQVIATITLLLSIIKNVTAGDPRLNYCGTSWTDANGSCSHECPGGQDSECPTGEKCFADCDSCCPSEGGYGGKKLNYCGTSWSNSNSKCGVSCPEGLDKECPTGESCFADNTNCSPSCLGNYNYCGVNTWENANSVCGTSCPNGKDDECPNGQKCFADCYNCPVNSSAPTPPTPTPPTPTPPTPTPPTPTPPTPTPPTPTPPTSGGGGHDSRLVAYLGNWQSCPSIEQVSMYTHIKISFAVTYTWYAWGNDCDKECKIATPPVCNNHPNAALIKTWQSMGKKVSLSFGGAGMGGSWASSNNKCWEDCFGKETQVVDRLVEIVNEMGLDGVDLDYEYYYDDNQNNSGFSKGTQAKKFLKDVTVGLREKLPSTAEISHAPMDVDLQPGKGYYQVLKEVASSVDFLNPQYYNGITYPGVDGIDGTGRGSVSALSHYTTIVNDIYNGDATKVVFGFCISDCSGTGTNINAAKAAEIMTDLAKTYECNGGAFFWVAEHDVGGAWSQTVGNVIAPNAGCSNTSSNTCEDSTYKFQTATKKGKKKFKDCNWVGKKGTKNRCKWPNASIMCAKTCDACDDVCVDHPQKMKFVNGEKAMNKNCNWTKKKKNVRCEIDGMKDACRKTCSNCPSA